MAPNAPAFPLLVTEMTEQVFNITLANDTATLSVSVPKEMVDAWFAKWQAIQHGTSAEPVVIGRWYTGEWPKVDAWRALPSANLPGGEQWKSLR